ncbi:hypothetical protein [Actinoplanes rectilineatus]|uniref:hypothetical protein n=1 Tax=Actinoplanes rectilineatus TaxID=113571 RepID=UPI0005F2F8DE|nr:hypothetical protein [Actinoplanes rectilineatus]
MTTLFEFAPDDGPVQTIETWDPVADVQARAEQRAPVDGVLVLMSRVHGSTKTPTNGVFRARRISNVREAS